MALLKFDTNGDGVVDWHDCPYTPGTEKAKLWWKKVEAEAKAVGKWNGKPLVPGERGPGQGDFDFLVTKLKVTRGLSEESARKVAGYINARMYGGK